MARNRRPYGWKQVARAGAALCVGAAILAGPASAFAESGRVTVQRFGDLGQVAWARSAIGVMAAQGVLRGVAPGQFSPRAATTRAEVAVMLGRLLHWRAQTAVSLPTFSDAANIPSWASTYVRLAASKGLLRGVGGHRFAPGMDVTWAQAAVLLARTFHFPAVTAAREAAELGTLPHGRGTPGWAREGVARDVAAGLFQGGMAARYHAGAPIPRAALAVLLTRAEQAEPAVVAPTGAVAVGPVTAVGPASVTVQGASGPQTVPIAPGAAVFLNGTPAPLAQIAAGDRVTIGLQAGQGAAVSADSGPSQPGANGAASGTLASLSGSSLVVNTPSGPTTYTLAPGATVTASGQPVAATSLAAGTALQLTLNPLGQVIALVATPSAPSGPIQATVVAIQQSNGMVTGLRAFEPTATGGTVSTYPLAPGATVSLNGSAADASALQVGDQVSLQPVPAPDPSGAVASVSASVPAGPQQASGSLASVSGGQIVVSTGLAATASVVAGPAPEAVSGGQVAALASVTAGTSVVVVGGAAGFGSALVIVG